jgi:hypothetical protein
MPDPNPKRPPMAKAIRKFLAAIRPNPPRKKHKNGKDVTETDSRTMMLVLHSLLWCARGVTEDAESINSDASLKQIAELAHCSPRACQYALEELEFQKVIAIHRRGHRVSNVYTIRRSPISDTQHAHLTRRGIVGLEMQRPKSDTQQNPFRHAMKAFRHAT